jgi:hypothetical protein
VLLQPVASVMARQALAGSAPQQRLADALGAVALAPMNWRLSQPLRLPLS